MKLQTRRLRNLVSVVFVLIVSWFALPSYFWTWIERTAYAGTTFTVNSTADTDDGLCTVSNCTLREAINASNSSVISRDPNVIVFNIPGTGVKTINVGNTGLGPLPAITRQVIVDGYTQGIAHPNTLAAGNDAVLLIELNGTGAGGGTDGVFINVSNCTVKGLVINRFGGSGIRLANDNGTIQGNYIGTNVSGTADLGNSGSGIFIANSSSSIIGGTTPADRNIISGNDLSGIGMLATASIQIQGNYIGTDKNGTLALGNSTGVAQLLSSSNIIGGTTGTTPGGPCTGACNLISSNLGASSNGNGIVITDSGSTLNRIRGNFIGTDVNGTADLGNAQAGVLIDNAPNNTIGMSGSGDDVKARNVISGNAFGIKISGSGATGTTVAGNYIGTTASGTALTTTGSHGSGVFITNAGHNAIGLAGVGNVISGNLSGISILGTGTDNTIRANYIGTDATGMVAFGNTNEGLFIQTNNNTIGGTTNAERNVISGNGALGINVNSGAAGNQVLGNYIGTKVDGAGALGNGSAGVSFSSANNNTLGGTSSAEGNIVAFNHGDGVFVIGGTGNVILGNSIHDNTELGIDLSGGIENTFGVTQNDPGDGDTGANNLQNFPVITSALFDGTTRFQGSFNSSPNTSFILEFFINSTCDPSSNGEGQPSLPLLTTATTNASGNLTFNVAAGINGGGQFITATATRLDASGNPTDTSEFSQCRQVVAPGVLQFSASNFSVNENGGSATITVTRNGGSDGTVSVNYNTSNGTATDGSDYTGATGTLGFGDGEVSRTFTVPIIDDGSVEGNETVNLALSSPTGGAILGSPSTAVLTILDNEVPSGPTLSIDDVIVREGHTAVFTISLSAPSTSTVTVNVVNADGSATEGGDYHAVLGSVLFNPGDTTRLLSVVVNTDSVVEGNETFFINLSSPVNASIADGQGLGTIIDAGSSLPTIQLNATIISVMEDCTGVNVTVTRLGNSSSAMTVDYVTSDGTAQFIAGVAQQKTDYTRAAGTLTFEPGATSKSFVVLTTEDSFVEGTEALTIMLSNATGGAVLASPSIAALRILDDSTEPAGNPNDDAQGFVCQHYHDFLNREADAPGLSFWTNQITSCGTDAPCIEIKRINVSAAFFLSIEFQETGFLVYRFYKSAFGNLPGKPVPVRYNEFLRDTQEIGRNVQVGIGDWQMQLENNKQAFALRFVQRSDFLSAYPASLTAGQFVDLLDLNAGAVLSAEEKATLVALLGSTPADVAKRAMVLRSVAEDQDLKNAEFNRAFVLMQYFGYLRRNPDDAPDTDFSGWQFWLGKLNQFNGNFVNAEMVKAFILSGEYRQRFGP